MMQYLLHVQLRVNIYVQFKQKESNCLSLLVSSNYFTLTSFYLEIYFVTSSRLEIFFLTGIAQSV